MVKNLIANAGDLRDTSSIPGIGRSSEEGNGNPLQYSCLENPRTEESGRSQTVGHNYIYIYISESFCCRAEINLTL